MTNWAMRQRFNFISEQAAAGQRINRADLCGPEEVAAVLGVPIMNVRPRCSELSAKSLILDTGIRRRAEGGRMAIVWRVA